MAAKWIFVIKFGGLPLDSFHDFNEAVLLARKALFKFTEKRVYYPLRPGGERHH